MALSAGDMDLIARTPGHPNVAGVVVDIPGDGGWATIVAMTDGTTSLYTSAGGGLIGAGEHEAVAIANTELLDTAQQELDGLALGDDTGHPPADLVRIFILTAAGAGTVDVPSPDFWDPTTSGVLIPAVQKLIGELREIPQTSKES